MFLPSPPPGTGETICSPWPSPPHLDTRERRRFRARATLVHGFVPRLTVERNDEEGTLSDKSREGIRVGVDLSRTSRIQRLQKIPVDGISFTVHQVGIRNTVHPWLRQHRPARRLPR